MAEIVGGLDALTVASVLVKAAAYLASLLAAGSALYAVVLAGPGWVRRLCARLAALSAAAALALTAARIALQAAFLGGGTAGAAVDPVLLSIVMDSPLGTSSAVRAGGLALVLAVLLPGLPGAVAAIAGAVLVAASFALVGHALGEPRLALGVLVAAHVLGVAFWIGAFAPLHALAGREAPAVAGEAAHRFGRLALWVVGGLLAAGTILTVLLVRDPSAIGQSAYGRLLLLKVGLVAGLLALAALNKERLTPALMAGRADAATALRRSIRLEGVAVVLVLLVTATFTTVASPPGG